MASQSLISNLQSRNGKLFFARRTAGATLHLRADRRLAKDPLAHWMMKEALDALLEHVDIGQGEEIDERRVLHMDLLDAVVNLAPLGVVEHRAPLVGQVDRLLIDPAGMVVLYLLRQDGVRDQLIRVDDVVGPAGGVGFKL